MFGIFGIIKKRKKEAVFMRLSTRSATSIVNEIGDIIGEKINLINPNGIIIASTDKARIGTFHAAAKYLIDNGLQEVIVKSDDEFAGSKCGTNLAITFQGKIIGVIGVTGPYQEVVKYGQIIKKMTEVLMLDQYYKEQKEMDNRIRERYLNEWMFGDAKNITPALINRGSNLKIDITIPRRVIAIFPIIQNEPPDIETSQRILDGVEKLLHQLLRSDHDCVWIKTAEGLLCAIPDRSDSSITQFAQLMKQRVEESFPVVLCIGIDSCYEGYMFINRSVIKAQKALKTALRSAQKGIRLYESINMEIFQSELSNKIKSEYIRRIFKGCSLEEISYWISILEIFYEEEGSITTTAQRLFIHKNTLQYKLNKIKEKTGYDPRSIRYSSLFYNAIHFYQDVKEFMIYSES